MTDDEHRERTRRRNAEAQAIWRRGPDALTPAER